MKTRLPMLKRLVALCCTVVTTAVFGQTTYTWTNAASIDIGLAANWDPNGLPSGASQDTAQWDGVVPGNLTLRYITGWGNSGFGTSGVNLALTPNQTGDVTILAPTGGNSPAAGIFCITNDSATADLHIGETSTARQLNFATRPGNAGTYHYFVNNSVKPATMDSSVTWVAGGGVACVMDFGGTGDWIVNHVCRQNNSGAGPVTVQKEGPGTMTWSYGGTFLASDALGPIGIDGGTLILKSAGLAQNFVAVPAENNRITNNATLIYDAGASDTIARLISGAGTLEVKSGTLTLSGSNEFSGNIVLSGGKLIPGSVENLGINGPLGVSNTISFTGGTLGFSGASTYDYSPRFSTAPGQAYRIDSGGQSVTLATGLTNNGTLTKLGSGTLNLSGTNSYSGLTTVSAGRLAFQSLKTGAGNITVNNSTVLGVTDTGTQVTPGTLTMGTSSLEFSDVNSTTTAPLAPTTLAASGTINFSINSGTFAVGQSYPLLTWNNGSAPAVSLGTVVGAAGTLSTSGNTVQFNANQLALIWAGTSSGNWDTTPAKNWRLGSVSTNYSDPLDVAFDDTAAGTTGVTINGVVQPASVTVFNNSLNYSVASSSGNRIGGSTGLTKGGNGALTLSGGANNYSGVTRIIGGTLIASTLTDGGLPSDIGAAPSSAGNLVFDGGTLQYNNGSAASINRLFTLGTFGGTIDVSGAGALDLNNSGPVAYTGTGARVLNLAGANENTFAAALADNGGATSLTKSGPGKWILTGTNAQTGVTTIANGTLQIGAGGAIGSPGNGDIINNASLVFNRSGTLTVVGTISGSGYVTNDGPGTIILPGDNTWQGGTFINAGTLQIGDGGVTGKIDATDPITDNGTLIVNSTGDLTLSGAISGTGQLIKRGSGLLKLIGNNTYTGPTTIDAGSQLQLWQGNTGSTTTSAITNNGTLIMMRQDTSVAIYAGNISGAGKLVVEVSNGNGGDSTLTGTNTYTGGTYILGGGLVLGDYGATPYGGSIVGDVFLTNDYIHATFGPYIPAILTFNRAEDLTFPGNIVGDGQLVLNGSGMVTLTGNNTFTNGTTINGGTLQVGAGGTSGSAGTGDITDNSVLVFNRSDSVTFGRVISGGGSLVQQGSGTLTLTAANTYSGTTTVSNGTLVINGDNFAASTYVYAGTLGGTGTLSGPVTLDAGTTLAPGASVGTLTINSDLSIGGNLAIEVNKSLSPSSDLVVVSGLLTNTGTGTLTVANLGPALAVGDTFTLFSQHVTNGAALTVTGGGATWINKLAVDGSITVNTVTVVTPPTLNFTPIGGNSLQFSWTGSFKLQSQTNSINVGISNNWGDYPGGTSGVIVPIDVTKATVFFRLAPTP